MLKRFGRSAALAALVACAWPAAALAAPPANDNFEQAAPLPAPPATVSGTVADATRQSGEPNHGNPESPAGQSVWYTFTPSANQRIAIDTCRSDFDSVLAVYTGTEVGSLQPVTTNDDGCGLVASRVSFAATAGVTYRIAVATYRDLTPDERGTFELKIQQAVRPANDAFADAKRLRGPGLVSGSNLEATVELGEPKHGDQNTTPSDKSVWFRYRPTRTQTVTLDTIGSSFDTILLVYRGNSVTRLRRVTWNDDYSGGDGTSSRVRFRARRGVTYRIAIDGFAGGEGDYVLNLSDGGVRGVGLTLSPEGDQTLRSARTRGLRALVGCRRTCRLRIDAVVGRRTAEELGLRRRILATARGRLRGGAVDRLATLRFSRQVRRALAGRVSLSVVIRATLVGSNAEDRSLSTRVNLSD